MTAEESLAQAAIRATLGTCSQAGDARKADAYAACFTVDGVLEVGDGYAGRDAIQRWMAAPSVIPQPEGAPAGAARPGYVSHHLTTCRIELGPDASAAVRTYFMVITAAGLDHSGYYDDRFRREGAAWLIAHRRPRTLWYAPESLVGGAARGSPQAAPSS